MSFRGGKGSSEKKEEKRGLGSCYANGVFAAWLEEGPCSPSTLCGGLSGTFHVSQQESLGEQVRRGQFSLRDILYLVIHVLC